MPLTPDWGRSTTSAGSIRRIFVVDDHPLMRRGLAALVREEPDLEICGESADSAGALAALETAQADIVIVDISLGPGDGIELVKRIQAEHPQVKTLVLSMHDECLYAERALRAGAGGYVEKHAPPDSILEAIRRVLDGHIYLSTRMNDQLLWQAVNGDRPSRHPDVSPLTARELEVFRMIGDARTTREIAAELHLSVKTIETHRDHIKRKLKLRNAAELSRCAVQWRLASG